MSGRFGLHMGNSTICLSINKDSRVDVVATKYGERCSPAFVAATTTDDEFMIGAPARERYPRDFLFTVTNNFQLLNASQLTEEQLADARSHSVCSLDDELVYQLVNAKCEYETTISVHQVAVRLFQDLYENATQAFISDKAFEAVLAVPVHFNATSRRAVVAAATEAGFNILQVISEPTAALLAYEIGFAATDDASAATAADSHVLVYRVGGLTADITVFRVLANGLYEQLDTVHLPFGGNRITKRLADYMYPTNIKRLELEGRKLRDTRLKLYYHAEDCKRVLSTMQSVQVYMENLVTYDDNSYDSNQTVTRARFENTFGAELVAFTRPVEDLLARLKVTIDKVILCGGAIKTPKLQAAVTALFPKSQILNHIQPDEVISIGCARQASFVDARHNLDIDQVDVEVAVLAADITIDGVPLFATGTAVPAERQLDARPVLDGGRLTLQVGQGSAEETDEVVWQSLGAGQTAVDVQARLISCDKEHTKTSLQLHVLPQRV